MAQLGGKLADIMMNSNNQLRNLAGLLVLPLLLATVMPQSVAQAGGGTSVAKTVVIISDGLRPDYVTPDIMPNTYALGRRGVVSARHFTAFPSYTLVASASAVTGCYPRGHGIMHNNAYHPEVGGLYSSQIETYQKLDEVTGGNLLTAPSIGETTEVASKRFLVICSGGPSSSWFLNHRGKGAGLWNVRDRVFLPESLRELAQSVLGELSSDMSGSTPRLFDAYLHHALGDNPPDVTLIWSSETDSVAHKMGVGSPETLAAAKVIDEQIGRIILAHENAGVEVNIIVTSDHGFSTSTGTVSLKHLLPKGGLGDDLTIVGTLAWLKPGGQARLNEIVEVLQKCDLIGTIYTKPAQPGSSLGIAPGTLSFDVIQMNHTRCPDVLVAPAWTDDVNEFGYIGTTATGGVATHGSDSPYDMHAPFVAAGPAFKSGIQSETPTGIVDITPTLLHLMGVEIPAGTDGRVMRELLVGGPEPEDVEVREQTHVAEVMLSDGLRYRTSLKTATVGDTTYIIRSSTERSR